MKYVTRSWSLRKVHSRVDEWIIDASDLTNLRKILYGKFDSWKTKMFLMSLWHSSVSFFLYLKYGSNQINGHDLRWIFLENMWIKAGASEINTVRAVSKLLHFSLSVRGTGLSVSCCSGSNLSLTAPFLPSSLLCSGWFCKLSTEGEKKKERKKEKKRKRKKRKERSKRKNGVKEKSFSNLLMFNSQRTCELGLSALVAVDDLPSPRQWLLECRDAPSGCIPYPHSSSQLSEAQPNTCSCQE